MHLFKYVQKNYSNTFKYNVDFFFKIMISEKKCKVLDFGPEDTRQVGEEIVSIFLQMLSYCPFVTQDK